MRRRPPPSDREMAEKLARFYADRDQTPWGCGTDGWNWYVFIPRDFERIFKPGTLKEFKIFHPAARPEKSSAPTGRGTDRGACSNSCEGESQ